MKELKFLFPIRCLMLGLVLELLSFNTSAQLHPILGKFYATEFSGKVYLNWQIISGSTCNGIRIYRSIDAKEFSDIGYIPGVCGNASSPQNYDFIDSNAVKNKINYYRLELGNLGFTELVSLTLVDLQTKGTQIRPNPINGKGKIFFDNILNQEHHLLIYNSQGSLVDSISSLDNYFSLNAESFDTGIYFFTITSNEGVLKVSSKFSIVH